MTSYYDHVQVDGSTLQDLTSSLRESFTTMTAKRDLWFDNYSILRQLTQTDEVQLRELLFVSKYVILGIYSKKKIVALLRFPRYSFSLSLSLSFSGWPYR